MEPNISEIASEMEPEMTLPSEMTLEEVIAIVEILDRHEIEFYLDGGWCVDALLGKQIRPRANLHIAIQHKDSSDIREFLEEHGYSEIEREDTTKFDFSLRDDRSHQIDIYTYVFDAEGNHLYGIPYPFKAFSGSGSIDGHPVKCLSPEWIVLSHSYEFDEDDYHDVKAICQHFNIEMTLKHQEFERNLLENASPPAS
jgi:lincosamide nucleotidyltransferase A/C/D/E